MNGRRLAARVWDALTRDGGSGSGNFGHAGRPGEVGGSGTGVATHELSSTEQKMLSQIQEVNRRGLRDRECCESYYTPVLQVAFDAGQKGIDITSAPVVSGIRYGKSPESGLSNNYSADRSERGLSLSRLDGQKEIGSSVWFGDRKQYSYHGVLLPYRGSDGEPLILPLHVEYLD